MKILVDVGVGKIVENTLNEMGHDVLAVRDIDSRLPDREILRIGVEDERLILTMDKDFGELVFRSKEHHHGILLLRLEESDSVEKASIVRKVFDNYAPKLRNNFSVYQNFRLRIRKRD